MSDPDTGRDDVDQDVLDDLDATEDADNVLGGTRRTGDPCDGGE